MKSKELSFKGKQGPLTEDEIKQLAADIKRSDEQTIEDSRIHSRIQLRVQ